MLTPGGRVMLREFVTTDETLMHVRTTGGLLGLRTGEEAMLDFCAPQFGAIVANTCDGSTRSFAQFYQYADDRGVNLAFGSDFNGFITQMVPRFGPDACASAPNATVRQQQIAAQGAPNMNVPPYLQEFRTRGLAHHQDMLRGIVGPAAILAVARERGAADLHGLRREAELQRHGRRIARRIPHRARRIDDVVQLHRALGECRREVRLRGLVSHIPASFRSFVP
jgi:hypothetical protein